MSHTIYDSPDGQADPRLCIDVTPEYVWFFGYDGGSESELRIRREELPGVARAINEYLAEKITPRDRPQPFVGLWISYMGAGRETSQVVEVTDTSVRLESGVVLSRSALVPEGPRWWQTQDSKLEFLAALRRESR